MDRGGKNERERQREREKKYRKMCIEKTGQNKGTAGRVLRRANYAARHVELEIVIGIGQGHLHMPDDRERERERKRVDKLLRQSRLPGSVATLT